MKGKLPFPLTREEEETEQSWHDRQNSIAANWGAKFTTRGSGDSDQRKEENRGGWSQGYYGNGESDSWSKSCSSSSLLKTIISRSQRRLQLNEENNPKYICAG